MSELDDKLQKHFSNMVLSDTKLKEILQAGEPLTRVSQSPVSHTQSRLKAKPSAPVWGGLIGFALPCRRWHRASATAILAIVISIMATIIYLRGGVQARGDLTLQEVAMNHWTRLNFEFEGDSLESLDERMQLLPFELTLPARIDDSLDVLGSRYCSLAGRLAAHIKFENRVTGLPMSLFVTTVNADLKQLDGEHGEVDGVDVTLWREAGLFYALAQHE